MTGSPKLGNYRLRQAESDKSEPVRLEAYHVKRLDDVREDLARLQGQMESVAKKEDVERAKTYMLVTGATLVGSLVVAALIAASNLIAKFWPS